MSEKLEGDFHMSDYRSEVWKFKIWHKITKDFQTLRMRYLKIPNNQLIDNQTRFCNQG